MPAAKSRYSSPSTVVTRHPRPLATWRSVTLNQTPDRCVMGGTVVPGWAALADGRAGSPADLVAAGVVLGLDLQRGVADAVALAQQSRARSRTRWWSVVVPTMRWAEATSMSDVSVHTWRSWTSTTPSTAARSARSASMSVPGGAACTRIRSAWPARRIVRGTIHTAMATPTTGSTHAQPVSCRTIGADDDADRADRVGEHLEVGALPRSATPWSPRAAARRRRGWRAGRGRR